MSYQEKNTWAYGVIAVLGYGAYLAVVLARADGGPLAEVAYAGPMLTTIGAAVLSGIVAGIVLGATSPDRAVRDEREREIERMGERVGQSFLVLGGLGGLVLALLEADWFWIANALYLGFVLSAVLSAAARLAAFRRGVGPW
ncbi:hypothetical protein [Cellulomonas pakistanensis]|uniref:Uncharacterized protein n=1 Tax=Cellulomonas pakistanensis TaxID=992287 RepID=A0A919P6K3_9CELL|nr:hypothetical protein [Cellulomonas pakistanensis]GIG35279.1 hypothetical protein Cpa01nite_06600 [Cellulomonas pakistanensis]